MLYIIKIAMHTGEDGTTHDAKAVLSVMVRLASRNEFKEQSMSSVQSPVPGTLWVDVPESTLKVL